MAVKKINDSLVRGDSASIPLAVPLDSYSVGTKIFFALKANIDNSPGDTTAVVKKTLTDANIDSTDANGKNYVLDFVPADTDTVPLGTYRAEFEVVSADGTFVKTFPDPEFQEWFIEVTGDVNRRTS